MMLHHRIGPLAFVAMLFATRPAALIAQGTDTTAARDTVSRSGALPFAPGEKLEYSISYGPLHVGSGSMELVGGESVRGIQAYHATFRIRGGTFFFHVDDRTDSWFDTTKFVSLRFTQDIHEGRYNAHRVYDLFPDSRTYVKLNDTTHATVAEPLDDASFLYFVRTLTLRVGAEYTFDRYFQLEGNPIKIRVLRAERLTVPAGTFDAIVVQPIIATRGLFSQRGHAEVWLRADGGHEVLQMKSHVSFGSLSLYLRHEELGSPPNNQGPAAASTVGR